MRDGCVQMTGRADKAANLAQVESLVARAAEQGADLDGLRIGLTICYDVRFPEFDCVLALAGAQLPTVPANFVAHTGKDHWETPLRARGIDNQCDVAAPARIGVVFPDRPPAYSRSLIVAPWGVVPVTAGDEETVIVGHIDMARVDTMRAALPALRHRRPETYRWPDR